MPSLPRSTTRHLNSDARRLLRTFEPSPEQRITAAVCRLVTALEAEADGSSTSAAHHGALIRHGENVAKAGGAEAMRAAIETACAARPERAAERRATISAAWGGFEVWKPRPSIAGVTP